MLWLPKIKCDVAEDEVQETANPGDCAHDAGASRTLRTQHGSYRDSTMFPDDSEVRRAQQNRLSARTDRFRLRPQLRSTAQVVTRTCVLGFLSCQGVAAPLPLL